MKKLILIVSTIFLVSSIQLAQIPNAGFESWTNGNPDGWFANNAPGFAVPVTQSSSGHSGSSAARLEVLSSFGIVFLPQLWSGDQALGGIPANQRYGSLTGFYQFSPIGGDLLFIEIWMVKGDQYLGFGGLSITNAAASYTEFSVPIEYTNSEVPDSAIIWFIVGGDTNGQGGNVGSFALIDDLSWGPTVGVQEVSNIIPEKFEMKQNYPNPFNPSTTIEFSIPEESFVELKVYNVLGKEVSTLAYDTYSSGTYKVNFDASSLSSGIYISKLIATAKEGNFTFSKSLKMTLLK